MVEQEGVEQGTQKEETKEGCACGGACSDKDKSGLVDFMNTVHEAVSEAAAKAEAEESTVKELASKHSLDVLVRAMRDHPEAGTHVIFIEHKGELEDVISYAGNRLMQIGALQLLKRRIEFKKKGGKGGGITVGKCGIGGMHSGLIKKLMEASKK